MGNNFSSILDGKYEENKAVCEGDKLNITCKDNKVIKEGKVAYGRYNNSVCTHSTVNANTPLTQISTDIPSSCINKNSCDLSIGDIFKTDPMPDVYKQQGVGFNCVDGGLISGNAFVSKGFLSAVQAAQAAQAAQVAQVAQVAQAVQAAQAAQTSIQTTETTVTPITKTGEPSSSEERYCPACPVCKQNNIEKFEDGNEDYTNYIIILLVLLLICWLINKKYNFYQF